MVFDVKKRIWNLEFQSVVWTICAIYFFISIGQIVPTTVLRVIFFVGLFLRESSGLCSFGDAWGKWTRWVVFYGYLSRKFTIYKAWLRLPIYYGDYDLTHDHKQVLTLTKLPTKHRHLTLTGHHHLTEHRHT